MKFSQKELFTIKAALIAAAEVYRQDADACSDNARLFAQFQTQRAEADDLWERIETEAP